MSEGTMLFIHALTALHPGTGTALGAVDLPIMRERHTGWPTIPASSLKGVLRDHSRPDPADARRRVEWETLFGPERIEPGGSDAFASAIGLTDARILAFPVRSLRGVFVWATCPGVLDRLARDAQLLKLDSPPPGFNASLDERSAVCPGELLLDNILILEELDFSALDGDALSQLQPIADWIARNAVNDHTTRERVGKRLVIISDDAFTYLVKHATEVVARIGLDYTSKTVREGALFYQEFLPAETIFYSLLFAEDSRNPKDPTASEEVLSKITAAIPSLLQIGGDETTGKGLCAVSIINAQETKK